jgi:hypothetical protein
MLIIMVSDEIRYRAYKRGSMLPVWTGSIPPVRTGRLPIQVLKDEPLSTVMRRQLHRPPSIQLILDSSSCYRPPLPRLPSCLRETMCNLCAPSACRLWGETTPAPYQGPTWDRQKVDRWAPPLIYRETIGAHPVPTHTKTYRLRSLSTHKSHHHIHLPLPHLLATRSSDSAPDL